MGFISSGGLIKVHNWLIHMESMYNFMVSSHVSGSELLKDSSRVVGSSISMSNMFYYSLMRNLYFFGTVRILLFTDVLVFSKDQLLLHQYE